MLVWHCIYMNFIFFLTPVELRHEFNDGMSQCAMLLKTNYENNRLVLCVTFCPVLSV